MGSVIHLGQQPLVCFSGPHGGKEEKPKRGEGGSELPTLSSWEGGKLYLPHSQSLMVFLITYGSITSWVCGSVQCPKIVLISLERWGALRGDGGEPKDTHRSQIQRMSTQQIFPIESE